MGKMKAELDIEEIMAAGDVIRWLAYLKQVMDNSIKEQADKKAMAALAASAEVPISEPVATSAPEAPKKRNKNKSE